MKKKLIALILLVFFISNAYAAVDRVIDPEIPIAPELVDFEENFDDVLVSLASVVVLGFATVFGSAIILLLILFTVKGIPIF